MVCVPTLLRGNAYLRDEHFITSSFEEVTKLLSQKTGKRSEA